MNLLLSCISGACSTISKGRSKSRWKRQLMNIAFKCWKRVRFLPILLTSHLCNWNEMALVIVKIKQLLFIAVFWKKKQKQFEWSSKNEIVSIKQNKSIFCNQNSTWLVKVWETLLQFWLITKGESVFRLIYFKKLYKMRVSSYFILLDVLRLWNIYQSNHVW